MEKVNLSESLNESRLFVSRIFDEWNNSGRAEFNSQYKKAKENLKRFETMMELIEKYPAKLQPNQPYESQSRGYNL